MSHGLVDKRYQKGALSSRAVNSGHLRITLRLPHNLRMKPNEQKLQPGDAILNHYMPSATAREREEARQTLYGFVACLFEIAANSNSKSKDRCDSPSGAEGATL